MMCFVLAALLASATVGADVSAFEAAKPVWAKDRAREQNLSLRFAADIELTGHEKRVIVRATGCSIFRLKVNGTFAGYGPARGPKGMDRVDAWDVTRFVRAGKNAIEIDVAGYNVPNYYIPDQPSYLQAEVVADGRVIAATGRGAFRTHTLNRVQKVPRYSYQRPFCEVWNASDPVVGAPLELAVQPEKPLLPRRAAYPTFAVNDGAKKIAEGRARYDAQAKVRKYWALSATPDGDPRGFAKEDCAIVPSYEVERYADDPKGSAKTATYDFGLLDCGFVGVKVKAREKGRVLVSFDEVLTDGKVDFLRGGTANVVLWNIDKPGELNLESFEPYAFRYAKFVVDGDIEIEHPYIRTYKSPSADGVACPTQDPELKNIFEAARETFKQNAVDVFTDCPGRERAGWLCDSYFTARVSNYLTGSLELEELFLENFLLADCPEIPKAMFPMCYPSDHIDKNFIPNWAMWLVLELEEYLVRGGDGGLVMRFEPKVMALIDYLKSFENGDGLLENLPKWVFVEWSECNNLTKGVNYPSNMTWARVLEAVANLYGRDDLRVKAARVRETIRRQSFNGTWFRDQALRDKDGRLVPNPKHTETCQYYAFYFGVATEKTHPQLWKTLVEEFGPARKTKNTHPDVPFSNAFIGNYLRLELLQAAGCDKAVEANLRGYFLKMAETTGTLWEHDSTEASCCHGFASYIAVVIDRLCRRRPSDVDIRDFGGDIPKAAEAAARAGGGRVVVPPGEWTSGTIWLKDNVELHLEKGAVIRGSLSRADYNADDIVPENWSNEGEEWSGGHLVFAYCATNVAVTGEGTIDGRGPDFFGECDEIGRFPNYKYGLKLKPTNREWFRPGFMLCFLRCHDVRLADVTLKNTPCWTAHFRCCDGVTVERVTVDADRTIANSDGISFDCTRNAILRDSTLKTGDDSVTVRASCHLHAATNFCENVLIENCDMRSCCYGVRLGVGTGTIRNVTIRNCRVHEAAQGFGFTTAFSRVARNVHISDVRVEGCTVREVAKAVNITTAGGDLVKDVTFRDCTFETMSASSVSGHPNGPVENILFENCVQRHIPRVKVRHDLDWEARLEQRLGPRRRDLLHTNAYCRAVRLVNCRPEAPGARGVLLLTFDDRNFAGWEAAMPLFAKYGAHATFFTSGPLDNIAVRSLKKLSGAGHSVGLHALKHLNADAEIARVGAEKYYRDEIVPQRDGFRNAYVATSSFAYPNCAFSEASDRLFLEKGFAHIRGGVRDATPYDPKGVRKAAGLKPLVTNEAVFFPAADLPNRFRLDTILMGEYYNTDIDEILACLDRIAARKEVLTICSHDIGPNARGINMKTEWLEKVLARAKALDLAVLGFDELPQTERNRNKN